MTRITMKKLKYSRFFIPFALLVLLASCTGYRAVTMNVDKAEKVSISVKDSLQSVSPI